MADRYTKLMLTVIAVALLALVAQRTVQPSSAQLLSLQKVQICDDLMHCASLSSVSHAYPSKPGENPLINPPATYTTYRLAVDPER